MDDEQTVVLDELGATRSTVRGSLVVVDFGDAREESERLVSGATSVVDESHCGLVAVRGRDAASFLHRLCTQDLRDAPVGAVRPAIFVSGKGRVDFDTIAIVREGEVLLSNRGGDTAGLLAVLERYHFSEDVAFEDRSSRFAIVAVFGNAAQDALSSALEATSGADPDSEDPVRFDETVIGDGGARVLVTRERAAAMWRALVTDGAHPAGSLAWDRLRIERLIPAAGAELDEHANPLEAGRRDAISFRKGCYVGQEVIARLDTYDKVSRRLASFAIEWDASAEEPAASDRLMADGRDVGVLTTVVREGDASALALGYLKTAADPESRFEVVRDGTAIAGASVRARAAAAGDG